MTLKPYFCSLNFFFLFQCGNSAISAKKYTAKLHTLGLLGFLKRASLIPQMPEESCSQRQVRDQSWDVTQTAIATPRGTAKIPLESAHKFTSTRLIREQFPSFQRKVAAVFFLFPGFCASLPRGKEAEISVCTHSLAFPEPFSSIFLEGGVQHRGVSAADPSPRGIISQHLGSRPAPIPRGRQARSCSAKAQALARVQKST